MFVMLFLGGNNMKLSKKLISTLIAAALCLTIAAVPVSAASSTYTVQKGDSMWKIAVKNEIGVSEIIGANPQVKNPNLIYPGQVLNIPSLDSSALSFEKEVVRLVNKERTSRGLKPLTQNWELSRVARYKSQDMKDNRYFAHNSPTYGSPGKMIRDFGISYRSYGENIAKGYSTPQAVVDGWMNSSGHRQNILNPSFTQIGVGYVASGNYWTQMFIG